MGGRAGVNERAYPDVVSRQPVFEIIGAVCGCCITHEFGVGIKVLHGTPVLRCPGNPVVIYVAERVKGLRITVQSPFMDPLQVIVQDFGRVAHCSQVIDLDPPHVYLWVKGSVECIV